MNQSTNETSDSRFNAGRIDLTDAIKHVEDGTFVINPSLSSSILQKLTDGVLHLAPNSIQKMWDEMKIERNARVAAITRIVMRNLAPKFTAIHQALEARLRAKTNTEEIPTLSNTFLDELVAVVCNTHEEKDADVRERTKLSVQRFDTMITFGHRFRFWELRHAQHTPQSFIFRGFNTATNFLVAYYQLLVRTYIQNDIPLTSENIAKGVRSALQHMHLFASFNIAHGPSLIEAIQKDPKVDIFAEFSSEFFTFDKETIRFTPKMDKIRAATFPNTLHKILEQPADGVTTGCPVSFSPTNFDDLATILAKMLGTYVETMTEYELNNVEKAVRNFLVSIS